MSLTIFLLEQKKKILSFLSFYFEHFKKKITFFPLKGLNIFKSLFDFIERGKMIRGGLVTYGYRLFSEKNDGKILDELIKISAAMELFQSALLIHDDIMDRDSRRRGNPSLFYHYATLAKEKFLRDPYHIGESIGICVGDMAFFIAFSILSTLNLNPEIKDTIYNLCSGEFFCTGFAQMFDVYWGAGSEIIDEQSILDLYVYKTGRYTFSLPLKIGALIAGIDEKHLQTIHRAGELLGIIFQIVDDDIGLFGNEDKTGKPVGSDLIEGKKTLYLSLLYQRGNESEKKRILSCLYNKNIKQKHIEYIRELMYTLSVRDYLKKKIKELAKQVIEVSKSLPFISDQATTSFYELIELNINRMQ